MKLHHLMFAFVIVVVVLLVTPMLAQKSDVPVPAPIPEQIGTAQKVFISNAGGENLDLIPGATVFSDGPDRPYNLFYAAIQQWGQYKLVSSPAESDLVLSVDWTVQTESHPSNILGRLRVEIVDPKTNVRLWTLTEHVESADMQRNRNKNLDRALNRLVSRLKQIVKLAAPSK